MSKKKLTASEPYLKGTLISVFVIGIIIFITWFSAFAFHLSR